MPATGRGIANPTGAIWTAKLILDHLGRTELGDALLAALESVLVEGRVLTRDLGGCASTAEWVTPVVTALRRRCTACLLTPEMVGCIWALDNHIRIEVEAVILRLRGLAVDHATLGDTDGWPPAGAQEWPWARGLDGGLVPVYDLYV